MGAKNGNKRKLLVENIIKFKGKRNGDKLPSVQRRKTIEFKNMDNLINKQKELNYFRNTLVQFIQSTLSLQLSFRFKNRNVT